MNILTSASRIVFVVLTIALCIFTYKQIVDPKDFVTLVSMVFSFYFAKNQNSQSQNNTQVSTTLKENE